jgi:hypothetical protein
MTSEGSKPDNIVVNVQRRFTKQWKDWSDFLCVGKKVRRASAFIFLTTKP